MSVLGSSDFAKGLSIGRQCLQKGEEVALRQRLVLKQTLMLTFQGTTAK